MVEGKVALYAHWFCWTQRPHHLASFIDSLGLRSEVYSMKTFSSRRVPSGCGRLVTSCLFPRPLTTLEAFRRWNARRRQNLVERYFTSEAECQIFASEPATPPRRHRISCYRVYDCMDDWSGFPGQSRDIEQREKWLGAWADRIWVVSRTLEERLHEAFGDKVEYVPNGVEYDRFRGVPELRLTRSNGTSAGRPRLGYVGAIESWFDTELVRGLADALPDWVIVLVGPNRLGVEDQRRLAAANIEHAGWIAYDRLPSMMATFDVAMIPFKLTPLIEATSPIKLYEYLAAGLPVVASPMREVIPFVEDGVVQCCGTAQEFARAARDLLSVRRPDRCQQIAKGHTWPARFQEPLHRVLRAAGIRPAPALGLQRNSAGCASS